MATLATMRANVVFNVGRKAGMDAKIDSNLNEATLQILKRMRPKEMQTVVTFTTTQADFDYTIAAAGNIAVANLYAILMVRNNTDDYRLTRGTLAEFESVKQSGSSSQGKPHKWFHYGNNLFIYDRIPDSTTRTLQVRYTQRPATMTSSVNFPLNDEWVNLTEELATAMSFANLNQFDKAQLHGQMFESLIQKMETPEQIEDEAPDGQVVMVSNTDIGD